MDSLYVNFPAGVDSFYCNLPAGVDELYANLPGNCVACGTPNIVSQPSDMSNWLSGGLSVITQNQAEAPDCTNTADYVSLGPGGQGVDSIILLDSGIGSPSVAIDLSVWIKRITAALPSGQTQLRLEQSNSSTIGRWTIDLEGLSEDWELLTAGHPAVTVDTPWSLEGTGSLNIDAFRFGSSYVMEAYFWCWRAVEI